MEHILLLIFLKTNLFIYLFWTALVLHCCTRAFSSASSRGYCSLRCVGFSLRWLLLLQSMGSRRVGFSSCGVWAQKLCLAGSVAVARGL